MKWVSCYEGALRVEQAGGEKPGGVARGSGTQLERGAVHELLFDSAWGREPPPLVPAMMWAREVLKERPRGALVCLDVEGMLYPPALVGMGIALEGIYLLRPRPAEAMWALAECLRCRGVGAVVAAVPTKMSTVEARRFQLAAERGGGTGILLRATGRGTDVYAAATRWLLSALPGDRELQRWKVQLVHGQGRQKDQAFVWEISRAWARRDSVKPFPVRAPAAVVDDEAAAKVAGAGA